MMRRLAAVLFLTSASGCATLPPSSLVPPPIEREFRGIWVASVNNIDWPSRRGLGAEQQRAELLAILDRAADIQANAVILQVRPSADALYQSSLEPWSTHLTGTMGVPPDPEYDPLAFAIEEAHKRGLELHAWFNPYRARVGSDTGAADSTHISVRRPDLVRRYGSFLWMDPGEPEVLAHTRSVLLDVVRRYDVDAIHIDDYFYPYQERDSSGAVIDFPDSASWQRYVASGGTLSRAEWRRENVDRLVAELFFAIREAKPWVRFGVSPIGVWRPGHPPENKSTFDANESIYADALKWWRNGWLDYFSPQLYWRVNDPRLPYAPILEWWASNNERSRGLYPGLFTSRADTVDEGNRWRANEILEQIRLTRANPRASGHIHFSMRGIMQNRDSIADRLRVLYATPALTPRPSDAPDAPPAPPNVSFSVDSSGVRTVVLAPGDTSDVWLWTVRARTRGKWTTSVVPGHQLQHALTAAVRARLPDEIVVTAVDRLARESAPVRLRVPRR